MNWMSGWKWLSKDNGGGNDCLKAEVDTFFDQVECPLQVYKNDKEFLKSGQLLWYWGEGIYQLKFYKII